MAKNSKGSCVGFGREQIHDSNVMVSRSRRRPRKVGVSGIFTPSNGLVGNRVFMAKNSKGSCVGFGREQIHDSNVMVSRSCRRPRKVGRPTYIPLGSPGGQFYVKADALIVL
ncbi:hypothetical protein T265_02733 [Opisthorchis viverrini]|uniref:Uncharacterized protein n=1 Tax=Opisthorchis viverrini TaxID=6198 RepID=A0A075A5M0_OPIVI|nr:hypothetical protein T265_02733 [Opisthorchis viverrini]KER30920.1 hypothetical protein T265_02733 [Opisthorchis viverrini]